MSEHEETIRIQAPAEAVIAFVADIGNMRRYLPTTTDARPQGPGRVHVEGEAKGHPYQADGWLRQDHAAGRLEWGADEGHYAGWLQVRRDGRAAAHVTVHLSFRGRRPGGEHAPSDAEISEGLRAALASVRNQVEGEGGKQEPAAATASARVDRRGG